LATIADNTTLTYTDNALDATLSVVIGPTNNECPKPKYIEVAYERLVGAGDALKPTYAWVGDTEIEFFDAANFVNVTNVDEDGTAIAGLCQDYSKMIIGSGKTVYIMDVSQDVPTIDATRANVGVLDGYSMVKVPAQGAFIGGVMFLSTLRDIRLFNGNFAQPVATSLDNLKADNLSQVIRPTMEYYATSQANVYAAFYDYKYHIIIGAIILIYDIRVQGWAIYKIKTETYSPLWNVFGVIDNTLYAGQYQNTVIDQFYSTVQYKGEDVTSYISSGQLLADDVVKYFQDFKFFVLVGDNDKLEISIVIDGQDQYSINNTVLLNGGAFDQSDFSSQDFETTDNSEDYRVVHIQRWGRWLQYIITQTTGRTFFRGMKLVWQNVKNKE
jgi:hypothetical protein